MPNSPGGKSYEHYDPKYNIYEEPNIVEDETEPPTKKVNHAQSSSSTLLLIGIVVVVIIAIALIIIIVFKMRTRSEVNQKVEESKSMQLETEERQSFTNGFHHQSGSKSGSLKPGPTTATLASNNNNSSSKPVKEWYV